MNGTTASLESVVAQHPFPDYQEWWEMGTQFTRLMANAIVTEWEQAGGARATVGAYAIEYIATVYGRKARQALASRFAALELESGEFDALSYAFFRDAFERIAAQGGGARERRAFTQRVGQHFFAAMAAHLRLDIPQGLASATEFGQLKECIARIGAFLQAEGYLREHFRFHFDVDVAHHGRRIRQSEAEASAALQRGAEAYALYEMGYPAILPSAVYLYKTIGEAQHHSSRTIEELFARAGYRARESDDFDPAAFPSELVVELWEIQARGAE